MAVVGVRDVLQKGWGFWFYIGISIDLREGIQERVRQCVGHGSTILVGSIAISFVAFGALSFANYGTLSSRRMRRAKAHSRHDVYSFFNA